MNDGDDVVRRPRPERRAEHRRRRNLLIGMCAGVVAALGVAVVVLDRASSDEVAASDVTEAADTRGSATNRAVPTSSTTASTTTTSTATTTTPPDDALPPSGEGRRVVFSIERQRMWWVDDDGTVLRTALVSGRERTPSTGTFEVFSKSLNATGLDGSRMDYFVRFTHGPNGWAIGFHDIPRVDGVPVQTEDELGQALSAGCIRQATDDAVYTWEFLDVGDTVVVVD